MSANQLRHSTDDLIRSLTTDLQPVRPLAIASRIAAGVALGVLASAVLLFILIGARPDLAEGLRNPSFWSKVAYSAGTAATALFVSARLSRPGAQPRIAWLLAAPVIVYMPVALREIIATPEPLWLPLLLGHGWRHCTWWVLGLSVPIGVGMFWAFKRFAPTELSATGAVVGVASAGTAAVIYCIHCPTDTAVFAITWYTLAFALAATLGSFFGKRVLRW